jgi:hypothetical protein
MIESVERRFGLVDRLLQPIQWLSDNGSPYFNVRLLRVRQRQCRVDGHPGVVSLIDPVRGPP